MDDTNTLMTKPFSKGDTVPEEGDWVCVPCGYKHHYHVGEQFGECMSCLSGTPNGEHEEFLEGEEMWEKVTLPVEETK
jgi:hypothetical protein